jgi:hypothetical protein
MRKLFAGLALACAVAGCQSDQKTVVQEISFLNWNVAHYCHGESQVSTIPEDKGREMLAKFSKVIGELNADVVGICEYSENFSTNGTIKASRDLFGKYGKVVGPRQGNDRNAVFYRTGTKLADKIQGYANRIGCPYYTAVKLDIKGTPVWFVQTQLDSHTYIEGHKEDRRLQIEQLIRDFGSEPHVVISGDFNVGVRMPGLDCFPAPEEYDPFVAAGYMLANVNGTGTYPAKNPTQPLDNVIVKGLGLSDVRFIHAGGLSTHLALVCKLQIYGRQ